MVPDNYREKYLNLLEETLCFGFWPEPVKPAAYLSRRGFVGPFLRLLNNLVGWAGIGIGFRSPTRLKDGRVWPAMAFTMYSRRRLRCIRNLCDEVQAKEIPGSFVECGVWRGGRAIYARACLDLDRTVYVCDSFKGFPLDPKEPRYSKLDFMGVTAEEVWANFQRFNLGYRVHFVGGWFKDSLAQVAAPIAILCVDGDLFSSTTDILTALYPKVVKGGIIVVDGWHIKECRRAAHTYRAVASITDPVVDIDGLAVYWRKS